MQRAWTTKFVKSNTSYEEVINLEVIPLPLELSRGVDLVSHDASDGLLNVLHPLGHFAVAHLIDLLNELVVFLPERHLKAGLNQPLKEKHWA